MINFEFELKNFFEPIFVSSDAELSYFVCDRHPFSNSIQQSAALLFLQMSTSAKNKHFRENLKPKSKQKIFNYYNKKCYEKGDGRKVDDHDFPDNRFSDTSDLSSSNNFTYSDSETISNHSPIVKFERKKLLKSILKEDVEFLVSSSFATVHPKRLQLAGLFIGKRSEQSSHSYDKGQAQEHCTSYCLWFR